MLFPAENAWKGELPTLSLTAVEQVSNPCSAKLESEQVI